MAKTIDNIEALSTRELLGAIVTGAIIESESVKFLCPRGKGSATMSRVRMELTRSRQRIERRGKRYQRFTLKQSIFPWTENGKTYDCVVVSGAKTKSHEMLELLDDMIAAKGVEL